MDAATIKPSEMSGKDPNTTGSEADLLIRSSKDKANKNGKEQSKNQLISETSYRAASDNKRTARRVYRERYRQKAKETKSQIETSLKQAEEELAALKIEQDHLCSQQSVLQAMLEYKNSLVTRAHSALGSFTSMSSTVSSFFEDLQFAGWNTFLQATDDQINAASLSDGIIWYMNGLSSVY